MSVLGSVRRRGAWWGSVGPALVVADLAAVVLAALVASLWAGQVRWLPVAAAALVAVAVAHAADLHRPRLALSVAEESPGLLVTAVAATAIVMVSSGPAHDVPFLAGPAGGAAFAALTLVVLALGHALVHAVTRTLRRSGRLRPVVVVGCGVTGRRLASFLLAKPEHGLLPVGFVSTHDGRDGDLRGLPLILLGSVETLPRTMAETHAEAALVALCEPAGDPELAAIAGCLGAGYDVYAVPRHLPITAGRAPHPRERVDGIPLLRLQRDEASTAVRAVRRCAEVLGTLAALAVLLPLTSVLAVFVRIETGGVLVSQPRGDEPHRGAAMVRFRTRRATSMGRPGTTWVVRISGRIGPVGWLLRRTRLYALPEVVRVLLGRARGRTDLPAPVTSARAARPHETQVDAGQLAS